jgi:hypothetical protein
MKIIRSDAATDGKDRASRVTRRQMEKIAPAEWRGYRWKRSRQQSGAATDGKDRASRVARLQMEKIAPAEWCGDSVDLGVAQTFLRAMP